MHLIANIDLLANPCHQACQTTFRGRDNWCLSDKRRCLRMTSGASLEFEFTADQAFTGSAELVLAACMEIHGSHAYIRKHLNNVLEIRLNGAILFDGILHWRSHEETVAFWNPMDFPFDAARLQKGPNLIRLHNKTTRSALGEFFDPQLLQHFSEEEAVRQLATIYLATLTVNFLQPPAPYPRISGVPQTAIAGCPFIVEVDTGPEPAEVAVPHAVNAAVVPLGTAQEFGRYRTLFHLTPAQAGQACAVDFGVNGHRLTATAPHVYANRNAAELIIGPGAETTYWHMLQRAAQDFYELESGNCLRMSIDDFLANLHFIPLAEWKPLIEYLVRRRRYYALARLRVPPYSRIQHRELAELADLGGRALFAGVTIPEPILYLHRDTGTQDLQERLKGYLDYFAQQMEALRLPGHRLVTFDSAAGLCGHYYQLGLDIHIAEIGPACNCLEEICCRGAATAYGRPWGVACAMHWYCGQGGQYAYDDARVRYAWLTMISSYLAGARQILWEGGAFDNLPVYNYILSEESWRDYGRRYGDPEPTLLRACFGKALNFHRAQQLPSPRVHCAVLHGVNDLFDGTFRNAQSAHGDLSLARSWTLLKVFLPHISWGRGGTDHGRKHRRWYSCTPYGQVDVLPAEAAQDHFDKYRLLALLSWNTMTPELHAKLVQYVRNGGILFLSLPHCATDTIQRHEWHFFREGNLQELCGVQARDLGGRLETVRFHTDLFQPHLPKDMTLTEKNPLFPEDFDELYPVFSLDITYFTGDLQVEDAEILAVSQRDEPVLLRRRLGKGMVYLLNTYHYPGRGRILDLAEGVLRTLAEQQMGTLRIMDPTEKIAWFEYAGEGHTRYFFLNTDWTRPGNDVAITVYLGGTPLRLRVREGEPLQLISDGYCHVLLDNPMAQLLSWRKQGNTYYVNVINGKAIPCAGSSAAIVSNHRNAPGQA